MSFKLPEYHHPDFRQPPFMEAPAVVFQPVVKAGVAPENYHATSIYPEYFQIRKGAWILLRESRMDCVVVLQDDDALAPRSLQPFGCYQLLTTVFHPFQGELTAMMYGCVFQVSNRRLESAFFTFHECNNPCQKVVGPGV